MALLRAWASDADRVFATIDDAARRRDARAPLPSPPPPSRRPTQPPWLRRSRGSASSLGGSADSDGAPRDGGTGRNATWRAAIREGRERERERDAVTNVLGSIVSPRPTGANVPPNGVLESRSRWHSRAVAHMTVIIRCEVTGSLIRQVVSTGGTRMSRARARARSRPRATPRPRSPTSASARARARARTPPCRCLAAAAGAAAQQQQR